ncbi:MAG: hypothetical protein LJE59_09485 [Chromatiaceae bacterium]|jgi:hypothetical protein|nr:hypothetical protein [Chromatiaceae bacterium]
MKRFGLALSLTVAATLTAHADTLLLDAIGTAPPNSASGVPRPSRGASMTDVKARFGEPASIKDAVGQPPITRWQYPAYTVYFEHDRVIDVVVHR